MVGLQRERSWGSLIKWINLKYLLIIIVKQQLIFKTRIMKAKKKSNFHEKTTTDSNQQKKKKTTVKKKKRKNIKNTAEDYIILNGNIYQANTKTERNKYSGFVKHIKQISNFNGKDLNKKINNHKQQKRGGMRIQSENSKYITDENDSEINLEECVNRLSEQQKVEMLKKLEKQVQKQPTSKLQKLQSKLIALKRQLLEKWQIHTDKINIQYQNRQIERHEHKEKLFLLNKMKDQKLKIIQCTKNLFLSIFSSSQLSNRSNGIQEILKKLNSLSSFDHLPIDGESARHSESHTNSIKSELQFQKLSQQIQKKQQTTGEQSEASGMKMISEQSLLISPESPQKIDIFQCDEGLSKKLKIPLLMTKEKIQEIEADKKTKEINKMKEDIEKRISFQMSQTEEGQGFFTTLAGINAYIMQLYQHIISVDLERVVQKLNFPFGKSIKDKISALQQFGQIDEFELYPVLQESELHSFNKEIILKKRKLSEYEKIHNKAIFECFNINLNAYRPYYELQGEVYPWSVSEKGITFYEINEENIEEVFEKTKIRVLQFASSLCGLVPEGCRQNEWCEILKEKRQQLQTKEEKVGLMEQYGRWDIKTMNCQALVRILICDSIFQMEIFQFMTQFKTLIS